MKFFNNDLGIHALIVYFCFVLIDLINDYKNVYFRNNVCLCGGFLCALLFLKFIFGIKGGYEVVFRLIGMLFNVILNLIIFCMKKGYSGVCGYG